MCGAWRVAGGWWKLALVSMLTILTFARVYSRCLARKDAVLLTVLSFFAKKFSESLCVSI